MGTTKIDKILTHVWQQGFEAKMHGGEKYLDSHKHALKELIKKELINEMQNSEHAVVENQGNAYVVSTNYEVLVSKALDKLFE